VADSPEGPFVARKSSLTGVNGIDPSVIRLGNDHYIYTSKGVDAGNGRKVNEIFVQKLLPGADGRLFAGATPPKRIEGLNNNPDGTVSYKEGPHVFQRTPGGPIYMLYARTSVGSYRLDLAVSDNGPMGRFRSAGVAVPVFCERACKTDLH